MERSGGSESESLPDARPPLGTESGDSVFTTPAAHPSSNPHAAVGQLALLSLSLPVAPTTHPCPCQRKGQSSHEEGLAEQCFPDLSRGPEVAKTLRKRTRPNVGWKQLWRPKSRPNPVFLSCTLKTYCVLEPGKYFIDNIL